jgi:hypothetical protein
MEFGAPWAYSPNKRMSLVLMDLRDTPRHSVTDDFNKKPHFNPLLAMLRGLRNPSISMPAIWIWIVNSANRLAQAKEYAMHSLKIIQSLRLSIFQQRMSVSMTSPFASSP